MNLKIEKSKKPEQNKIELSVEAPLEIAEKTYHTVIRNISENIDIPGFRKGKAPREMVEKQVGVPYISQKAFESVFYEILHNVSTQEKLDIVDVIEISSFELLPGKPLTFKVIVELKPEVKLGKYVDLKVKAKKIIYDKELFIQKTLEKIANNFITFKKITDGNVKEGDLVTLDFEGKFEDGTEVPGGKAENFQALLDRDKFLPDFVDKLKGVKVGDTKEITITFPENYLTGFPSKKANFKVKINSIEEKILPEINDEFAKKVGIDNLKLLKEKIVEQMQQLQEIGSQREFENKVVDQIVKDSKYEIPETMIEKEINYLLQDVKMQCEKSGINWSDFKSDPKNKELFDKATQAAKNRISIDLILNAIVKKENIIATGEEVSNEMQNRIGQLGEKYKHLQNDKAFINSIHLVALRNKAIDFLIKNNKPVWEEELTSVVPE
ncbi:MAG: trigger factor [Candidatus Melainabacteria bacterium]|nr:trigger factor [Candidatus Melainabacteria bacterium]